MRLSYADCLIANAASLQTGEVDVRSHDIVGIEMPAAWTAASITFQGCFRNDGASGTALTETFQNVFDGAGAELTITTLVSQYVVLTQAQQFATRGLARIKIRSGTSGVAVNQGAARTVRLILIQNGD